MNTTKQKHNKTPTSFVPVRQNLILSSTQWQEKEKPLKAKLKNFLETISQNQQTHSHWLNTLAFMEYIGCRKIIKSQHAANLNLMLLQHISEEARHAFHFKKLAHKVSPVASPNFKAEHTLKGPLAEDYFQAIDHKVEQSLSDCLTPKSQASIKTTLNYFYTTWLIEERALMVYNIYNKILKTKAFPFNLDFILREEDGHLKATVQWIQKHDPQFKKRSKKLMLFEQKQFALLVQEWNKQILN